MSEFDILNGKLDELLRRTGPAPAITPETPVPLPHPDAPPPVPHPQQTPTMTDILFPRNPLLDRSNDQSPSAEQPRAGEEPVPTQWEPRRFVCRCQATTYTIRGPVGKGFMVTGGDGGYDAAFNGVFGACTIRFNDLGIATLTVDKSCVAFFDPI